MGEGDEYKLVLNMQQYSPHDINVKHNGHELTVEYVGQGEQFHQTYLIPDPDTIDLDAFSSSFSSNGVLTIKAPKVKEGDKYELALNMQQYSPDDININLNGQELTVEAVGQGKQFHQKHLIPDTIDLDALSSTFSLDGVLHIKAPKK